MNTNKNFKNKNIILFVGNIHKGVLSDLRKFEKKERKKFRLAVIFDPKSKSGKEMILDKELDIIIKCDMSLKVNIKKAISFYKDELLVVTVRSERDIPYFQKIIPFVKDKVKVPSVESLNYVISKLSLRKKLLVANKKITPNFIKVTKANKTIINKIEKELGFPVIIKPSGLANSALISTCKNKEELEKTLKETLNKITKIYKKVEGRGKQELVVESFLDGKMYSVDICITDKSKIYFLPFVREVIGVEVGFDDFFTYKTILPTKLTTVDINSGQNIVKKAIKAIGLKNTVAHIDLIKTKTGWKIIEIAARIGAFRRKIYKLSFGIDQSLNDILNKILGEPIIKNRVLGYSAVFNFFASKEGLLRKIEGLKKVRELDSFYDVSVKLKKGERCLFAKNGGMGVLTIKLFNKKNKVLSSDVKRVESCVKIHTN